MAKRGKRGIGKAVAAVAALGIAGAVAYFLIVKKAAGGGGLSLTITTPSVLPGATLSWTSSGGTPNGQLQMSVLTNTGTVIVLTPNSVNDIYGRSSGSFTVGPNIPVGFNTLRASDLSSNVVASATFNVA